MTKQTTRRDILKGSLAAAGLGALGIPEWAMPALAQGSTLVEFTDLPDEIVLERTPDRRIIDVRYIDGPFTPRDQWFTTQHYGHPEIDPGTYRLRVSGMVDQEIALSLDEIKALPGTELVFGFECSGNGPPLNGLSSNAKRRRDSTPRWCDFGERVNESSSLIRTGTTMGGRSVEPSALWR